MKRYGFGAAWMACLIAALAAPAAAQQANGERLSLVVLPLEFSSAAADFQLQGDAEIAQSADAVLRSELDGNGRYSVQELDRTAAATRKVMRSEEHCLKRQCALEIGRELGADRVLLTTLVKLSGLIWMVSGSLLDTRTGEVLNSESLELKGNPADMVKGGARSLARRMSRS